MCIIMFCRQTFLSKEVSLSYHRLPLKYKYERDCAKIANICMHRLNNGQICNDQTDFLYNIFFCSFTFSLLMKIASLKNCIIIPCTQPNQSSFKQYCSQYTFRIPCAAGGNRALLKLIFLVDHSDSAHGVIQILG
jgi:hypothetical protein